MDEFNLDFLKTPPKHNHNGRRADSPFVFNEFEVPFANKKRSKKIELAANIAKVDELVQEIDKLKNKNLTLQQQLKDFQSSAQQVQELYLKEKNVHSVAKQDLEKLQKEHSKIDEKLANMTLVNEQLKARLDEYDGRPISFENLVVKYVKVMTKCQETHDKDLLERLREYCTVMKYKVPRAISPKKSRTRGNKIQTREASSQCDLIGEFPSKDLDCSTCKIKAEMRNQSTQCFKIQQRDQASQYISTMVTRQTNTENTAQRHIQTMFPETPPVDDILKVYAKWSNIRSVSPLLKSPTRNSPAKELLKSQSTTGTCTMLCNIRRKIDYLPSNNSSNIKQEYFTPSASPTPNTDSTSTTGHRINSLSHSMASNISSHSLLSLFNTTSNSPLGQLSFEAFNELWQIFGKMLLSLIQSSNAGIASSNHSSHINQQQFLDWLLELYTNSNAPSASASDTSRAQNLEHRETNDSLSPLIFNERSILSTNILRPQPQKTLPEQNADRSGQTTDQNKKDSGPNLKDSNSNKRTTERSVSADISLENSKNNETQHENKQKSQQKLLDEIQELLPALKLKKGKRKILKRLLKNGCHRKKSNKIREKKHLEAENKQTPVVVLANDCNVDDTTETAIDFLKTFAVAEANNQPLEEDLSENEKMFFKQVSNDKLIESLGSNIATSVVCEESSCVMPTNSLTQFSTASKSKSENSICVENKYQLLFGDSDTEESENFDFKRKPVIKSTINVESNSNECTNKSHSVDIPEITVPQTEEKTLNVNCNFANETTSSNIQPEAVIFNQSTNNNNNTQEDGSTNFSLSDWNQREHVMTANELQSSFQIPEHPFNSNEELSLPIMPTENVKDLEYTHLAEVTQFADDDLQNLSPSLIINNNSFANIEKSLAKDLQLSLDIYCGKENNELCKDINKCNKLPDIQDVKVQRIESSAEKSSFNPPPRLNDEECSNANRPPEPVTINSTIMHSSDFEKDFELSSDNESFSSDNYLSSTTEVICEENEIFDNSRSCEDSIKSHTSYRSEAEQTTTNKSDSMQTETTKSKDNVNILLPTTNENNFVNKFKPKNDDDILYLSPSKEKGKNNHISLIGLSRKSNLNNIVASPNKTIYNNKPIRTDESFEAKEKPSTIQSSQVLLSASKTLNSSENIEPHTQAFNNHKQELQTHQPSCSQKSIQSIPKTSVQNNKLTSKNNCIEKTHTLIKRLNNDSKEQNYHCEGYMRSSDLAGSKTKQNSKQLSDTSSSIIRLSQSQEDVDGTVNSSNCSIVTISDSSPSDMLTKSEEIFTDCNKKDNKILGLGSLKLLHINETFGQQKSIKTSTPKENNTKNMIQDEINRTPTANTKESSSFLLFEQEISQGASECISISFCSLPTGNTSKNNSQAFISQQISNIGNTNGTTNHEYVSENTVNNKTTFEESFFTNIISTPHKKVPIQYETPLEDDKCDLNDSLSMEDELMIDEELPETTSNLLQSNPLEIARNCNRTLDSSQISTLLNNSDYNEVLTESLTPIVNDLLQEDFLVTPATCETKSKRGRKRKNEYLTELQQPCKRSQRLKAKQMILEESLNLSEAEIDITKRPNHQKSSPKRDNVSRTKRDEQNSKMLSSENPLELGFFRERDTEYDVVKKLEQITNGTTDLEEETHQTNVICENNENRQQEDNEEQILPENLNQNIEINYTPQSPPSIERQENEQIFNECINIPLERPKDFIPQDNNPKLFDALISSYKNEHQKQVLESISLKELKRTENVLQQFKEQISVYCSNGMELDLYSTSTSLINKLLNISQDYNVMQRAIIAVAQGADGSKVTENEFPSVIQEMPPRHLSECLQRLFTFLRIIVTRSSSFCHELNSKIDNILFNPKQAENLSLQETLNLTQLYLMGSKVQEYLQVPKHPARLFIAKCLYYYLQKSILMIHEVLLWYPTVLPHREDRSYDRSDALISVMQQILMNTKYDMDKADLRGKLLISKLRFEYHFEPFKPTQEEVIKVLVEKLKNSKFYNISLAFCLLCKRIGVIRTQNIVLNQYLMPLANEYYSLALKSNEYDERIGILLEIISMLVKPLPLDTDIKRYFLEFARFLNGFERQIIQEAALCSILRLQRFNVEYCYILLSQFQPTYNLRTQTQAMLKTFLYRRPQNFWRKLKSKNLINCN